MSHVSEYCRAYPADDLRRFRGWNERAEPMLVEADGAAGGAYFFLHDDFVVTAGVQRDERVVFDDVGDAWKAFCRETLGFAPPSTGARAG